MKKFFTLLAAALMSVSMMAETYTKTAYADLKSGDVVIITEQKGNDVYAASNDQGTAKGPVAVAVTVANDAITTDSTNILWTVVKDGDNISFMVDTLYLYCTNTNNGMRVGKNVSNSVFSIDAASGYLFNNATSRYIGVYNQQDWRCYTSVNDNITGQTLAFFALAGESSEVGYPYAVRYAGEVQYPYLKVGDRLAAGTKIIGDANLQIRVKAERHKSSGNLASVDLEFTLAEFDSIGELGYIGSFGGLSPVNLAGENGIEWEVVETGPLGTGPLEIAGVGYPYPLKYVDEVACIDVKAGDSVSAGARIKGVGYIRFIGGSYKLNGELQADDSEVLEIKDYEGFGYPYCNDKGEFIIGDKVFTSCDPAGNTLRDWRCKETGPLTTGPLGTGPLGTGPLAFEGTGPLVEEEVKVDETVIYVAFPSENRPENIEVAGTFEAGAWGMRIFNEPWFTCNEDLYTSAEDTLKFRSVDNHDMVLCQFIPANGDVEGKWVQLLLYCKDYAVVEWKLEPTRLIEELDFSNASQYAWKEGMPEPGPEESAIESIAGETKAVKVVRDGQVYILRGDKTYNILGAEVK